MSELLRDLNNDLANVTNHVRQSLVKVSNGMGGGAGTIWHGEGLIITNAHVIAPPRMMFRRASYSNGVTVTLQDRTEHRAQVLAMDEKLDIAALAIDAHDLPTIELGHSSKLQPGQWVTAIGHPFGVEGAATSGIVIGGGDDLPEIATGREWVMVSLHLRPGHSGGPLVDCDGRLVGINTIMTGPAVGGAVPVDVVKRFLKRNIA